MDNVLSAHVCLTGFRWGVRRILLWAPRSWTRAPPVLARLRPMGHWSTSVGPTVDSYGPPPPAHLNPVKHTWAVFYQIYSTSCSRFIVRPFWRCVCLRSLKWCTALPRSVQHFSVRGGPGNEKYCALRGNAVHHFEAYKKNSWLPWPPRPGFTHRWRTFPIRSAIWSSATTVRLLW